MIGVSCWCCNCGQRVTTWADAQDCPLCGSSNVYTARCRIQQQMRCPGCNRLFTRSEGEDRCYVCGCELPKLDPEELSLEHIRALKEYCKTKNKW
jgi:Zn finger protein HypA/HybF involved in hydrogenase expression